MLHFVGWFLDKEKQKIFVYPKKGETSSQALERVTKAHGVSLKDVILTPNKSN